jgi:sigma-B regulation protein RsbU (phosphoserine phosphatase)
MAKPHRIRCAEIWGGNRGDELDVETSGVRACLYSKAFDSAEGGDVYYFSVCGSDLLTRVAIADVVGHGANVASISQWLYESLVERMNSPAGNAVLADLNVATCARGLKAMSTAVVAAFYRTTGSLYFSYAGHHELLYLPVGSSQWTGLAPQESDCVSGLPLGVVADCEFIQQEVSAQPGDRLFLYSDGLTEAANAAGELFGAKRLLELLNRFAEASLSKIRSEVLDAVLQHNNGTLDHDDVTFMVLELTNEEL